MQTKPRLISVLAYFLRLGLTGFGGPVALANYMRRDLVERHRWLGVEEFDEGLAIATACPGPLAYQLGVYCGYLTHGTAGALGVALAFAAAPFFIVVSIAAIYVHYGSTWVLRGLFYGIGPVVIALIVRSCWDLGKKTLRSEWLAYAFAAAACAITIVVQRELTVVFLVAGALGVFLFSRRAPVTAPVAAPAQKSAGGVSVNAVAPLPVLYQSVALPKIFWFFFKTGFLVFGSGLVVVPFLKAYLVDQYHWLSNQAFLDAVAVGIVSPGPVVITATFVGFLNHGLAGAVAATAGMFAPSLIFVLAGTPILRRYRTNARVQGFVRGITVAVVGVLVGTSFLVARSSIHDLLSAAILIAAAAVLWSKWKVPEQALIAFGAVVGLVAFGFGPRQSNAASLLPLEHVADISLPGNATRLDYQSLDAQRHLLFIAHLGDSEVIAVDTATRKIVARVRHISQVHGVLAVPQLTTVYASATGTNEVVAIDERSFRVTARTGGGVYPDGIAFDPFTRRLFVSDEHGDTDTVIDTRTNTRIATIRLGGQVGNTQYDPVSRHIFVNVQTLGQLVEIDPKTSAIVRRVGLSGCAGNHGLLIDERHRRAFIACEDNATFVWLDMKTIRIVKTWKIGDDPDVLAYDPSRHRLYVSAESGVVSVFADDGGVRRQAQGYFAPAAHTVSIDPQTHFVYFPLENIDGKPVLRIMAPK